MRSRVTGTRKLLLTAAIIMSVLLMGSSICTVTLIEPEALQGAMQPIAHWPIWPMVKASIPLARCWARRLVPIYDLSTVVILWFAGASAMAGLLNLVPQYLPRYGMAPEWARASRPLVLLFTAINLLVTWLFNADVLAQGSAYATGVIVLMSSAGFATVVEKYAKRTGTWWQRMPWDMP